MDDHNAAVHLVLERGRIGETYLIGSGEERSNKEVFELILELMGGRATGTNMWRIAPATTSAIPMIPPRSGLNLAGARNTPISVTAWRRRSSGIARMRAGGGR